MVAVNTKFAAGLVWRSTKGTTTRLDDVCLPPHLAKKATERYVPKKVVPAAILRVDHRPVVCRLSDLQEPLHSDMASEAVKISKRAAKDPRLQTWFAAKMASFVSSSISNVDIWLDELNIHTATSALKCFGREKSSQPSVDL